MASQSTEEEASRYNVGKPNTHLANDSKDQRSITNRVAAEQAKPEAQDDRETRLLKENPTLPAKSHGNEPSRGAKIDAQLESEDKQRLKEKGVV